MTPVAQKLQDEAPTSSVQNASDRLAPSATVYVYGYGPATNPFYKQGRAFNATADGALLHLDAVVSRGQKLLVMNGTGREPVEAEVVRTRTLNAKTSEVEIVFALPRPDFWTPLRATASR
jgi:hypothetical protein